MTYAITATTRTQTGRRAKQALKQGQVPAVVYGHGVTPRSIQVPHAAFKKLYRAAGSSSLVDLTIDAEAPVKALIQDVQVVITTMEAAHVDFRQINMKEKFTVKVPLTFVGESAAVKALAGTPVYTMHEVTVSCLPADLPHEIAVDMSAINTFEDRITVSDLKLPAGVEVIDDADQMVASVERPLTEDELKKLDEASSTVDVTAIKTEAEEKKAAEAAKKAEDEASA